MIDAGSVYVFGRHDGLVKVGFSKDTKARAAQLRVTLPGGRMLHERQLTALRSRRAERLALNALSAHCIGGEWFAVDADTAIMAVDGAIDIAAAYRFTEPVPQPPRGVNSWVRICRIVMDWTIKEFAARSSVSVPTIRRAEADDGGMSCAVADKLLRALFAAGWTMEQTIPGIISRGLVLHEPPGHGVSVAGGVPLFSDQSGGAGVRREKETGHE